MYALKTSVQKILLIDADEDDQFIFEHILREVAPFIHLKVRSSEEGIEEVVKQWQPDLIFLDINLPMDGGIPCLKKLQQCSDSQLSPVIIYSSLYNQKVVEKAFELGAVHFVQKVDHYAEVKKVLCGLLEMPRRA